MTASLVPGAPIAALWPEPRSRPVGHLYGSLYRAGIHDVGTLASCTRAGLLEVDRVGPLGVKEICRALASHGLSLRGEARA